MTLERDQAAQDDHDDDERQDAVAEGPHFVAVGGDEGGEGHDDGDLRQLGGLEGAIQKLEPAADAVDLGCCQHQTEQKHIYKIDHRPQPPDDVIVDRHDDRHNHHAHHNPHQLKTAVVCVHNQILQRAV